ncbi:hypothetical protein LTR94_028629 [Friedmanniomyces endolithicus]|nr:hypothetical protein LTR94_028629 [Friedmanniomyces endolithicus]
MAQPCVCEAGGAGRLEEGADGGLVGGGRGGAEGQRDRAEAEFEHAVAGPGLAVVVALGRRLCEEIDLAVIEAEAPLSMIAGAIGLFSMSASDWVAKTTDAFFLRRVFSHSRSWAAKAGLSSGQKVTLASDAGDNHDRRVGDLIVVEYNVPPGCIAAYYPECNPLIPLEHHAEESHVPAAKSVPVRIVA